MIACSGWRCRPAAGQIQKGSEAQGPGPLHRPCREACLSVNQASSGWPESTACLSCSGQRYSGESLSPAIFAAEKDFPQRCFIAVAAHHCTNVAKKGAMIKGVCGCNSCKDTCAQLGALCFCTVHSPSVQQSLLEMPFHRPSCGKFWMVRICTHAFAHYHFGTHTCDLECAGSHSAES